MHQVCTQVLEALLIYQKENHSQISPSDFAHWMIEREKQGSIPNRTDKVSAISVNEIEEEISRLLVLMYRYAKGHLKTYLADFEDMNQEDFTYIYALKRSVSLTKIQLIEMNIHDKTTGLEVIRRLVKSGMIVESKDEQDKRSIRLRLTPKGENSFLTLKNETRKVAKLITGELVSDEKYNLYQMLIKLDAFHQPLFSSKHKADLDTLLASMTSRTYEKS
jgi:DNA-binding MarR family transcriptional regulator